MQIIEYPVEIRLSYPLDRLGEPSGLLFFDIETTGFSAFSSALYLIGAVYLKDGVFMLRQWFSESLSDELPLLRSFFDFALQFKTLVHFNGEGFDLRYLADTASQYGIRSPLSELASFDILKQLRKSRSLLELSSMRQKSIERFLRIDREDRYSGGELIAVYEAFLKSGDEELKKLLLLHNAEDLSGMPGILPALLYRDALLKPPEPESAGKENGAYVLTFRYNDAFPVPLKHACGKALLSFCDDRMTLSVPLYAGTLRYYYPDFKNYYYLPHEDTAIHKKLAQFVEKPYRVQATPETCYTRMEGLFVPAAKESGLPVFHRELKDNEAYHRIPEDPAFPGIYGAALLREFLNEKSPHPNGRRIGQDRSYHE